MIFITIIDIIHITSYNYIETILINYIDIIVFMGVVTQEPSHCFLFPVPFFSRTPGELCQLLPRRRLRASRIPGLRGARLEPSQGREDPHFDAWPPLKAVNSALWEMEVLSHLSQMGMSENRLNPYTQWFC